MEVCGSLSSEAGAVVGAADNSSNWNKTLIRPYFHATISASSAPTVWYLPDLETGFARLSGI